MGFYGYHVGGETLMECLSNIAEGNNAAQIFTTHPKDLFRRIDRETATSFIQEVKSRKLYIVSHCILMTNFASTENRKRVFSINLLCAEVKRCMALGINDIVIHPGSSEDPNRIAHLAESINSFFIRLLAYRIDWKGRLLVENMVGAKDMLPMTPDDYVKLFSHIHKDFLPQVGIVLDTAHCWGYGMTPNEYIEGFTKNNILDKLWLIHFNNNKNKFGSKKERHCALKEGEIPVEVLFDLYNSFAEKVPFIVELK